MKNTSITILILFIATLTFAQNVVIKIEDNRFIERRNNKYGVTDSLKNIIIPFKYSFIEYKNKRLIIQNNKLNGFFSVDNEMLLPIAFEYILPRKNSRFILFKNHSLNGLSDQNGKLLLALSYKFISSNNDDFYITKNAKNAYGVYDFNGKNIIPEAYKFYTIDNYKIFATKDNKAQILDLQNLENNLVLDERIELIETIKHYSQGEKHFQIIKKENRFGLINAKNETVIPLIYDEIRSSENWRYYIIKQNNKIGIINVNGILTKKPIYDDIQLRKEYVILKRKNLKDEFYTYEY